MRPFSFASKLPVFRLLVIVEEKQCWSGWCKFYISHSFSFVEREKVVLLVKVVKSLHLYIYFLITIILSKRTSEEPNKTGAFVYFSKHVCHLCNWERSVAKKIRMFAFVWLSKHVYTCVFDKANSDYLLFIDSVSWLLSWNREESHDLQSLFMVQTEWGTYFYHCPRERKLIKVHLNS